MTTYKKWAQGGTQEKCLDKYNILDSNEISLGVSQSEVNFSLSFHYINIH